MMNEMPCGKMAAIFSGGWGWVVVGWGWGGGGGGDELINNVCDHNKQVCSKCISVYHAMYSFVPTNTCYILTFSIHLSHSFSCLPFCYRTLWLINNPCVVTAIAIQTFTLIECI